MNFHVPESLKDIYTSPPKAPSVELVHNQIVLLKEEFVKENLTEYIDVYENYAMIKFDYNFQQYIKAEIKRCRKWCDEFNYANKASNRLKIIDNNL